eukprot:SAG11_NODE_592_length_8310_cov_3.191868_7_plen_104_part_00
MQRSKGDTSATAQPQKRALIKILISLCNIANARCLRCVHLGRTACVLLALLVRDLILGTELFQFLQLCRKLGAAAGTLALVSTQLTLVQAGVNSPTAEGEDGR